MSVNEQLDIIHFYELVNGLKSDDAIRLLINIQAFDDEKALRCALLKNKSLSDIILKLSNQKLQHRYTEDMFTCYSFLEALLLKSALGLKLEVKHPEVLAYECTRTYEFSEAAETYCAYHLMHMNVKDFLNTCQFYHIDALKHLANVILETWVYQYFRYIQTSVEINNVDQAIIQQLHRQFSDLSNTVSYGEKACKKINFLQLCKQIEIINNYQNDFYYNPILRQFINRIEFSALEDLVGMLMIPQNIIDHNELLYSYIRKAKFDEKMRWDLLEHVSKPNAYEYCTRIFEKLGMMNDFKIYHSMVVKISAAGWCIEHGYCFDDKEIDVTYVVKYL